jgi:hypothetical protein
MRHLYARARLTTTLTTKGRHSLDNAAFGGFTLVRNYSVWTLANCILSNLKTRRDEIPSRVNPAPSSRPKFSPSQEITLSFIV